MPTWVTIVLATAGVISAVAVIWTKLLRPAARLVTTSEVMVPLLIELTEVFRGQPESFRILSDIAGQFKTDSGTSLRDVVNRLELAALENHHASERLKVGVELSRVLAERDREAVQHLIVLLDRLSIRAQHLEDDRAAVAANLVEAERRVAGVAVDASADRATRAAVAADLVVAQRAVDVAAGAAAADRATRAAVAADLAVAERRVAQVALDATADRATRAAVAADLVEAERRVAAVAADLAASHDRADAAPGTDPGAAADAAARSVWDGIERRVADQGHDPDRRNNP